MPRAAGYNHSMFTTESWTSVNCGHSKLLDSIMCWHGQGSQHLQKKETKRNHTHHQVKLLQILHMVSFLVLWNQNIYFYLNFTWCKDKNHDQY